MGYHKNLLTRCLRLRADSELVDVCDIAQEYMLTVMKCGVRVMQRFLSIMSIHIQERKWQAVVGGLRT